MCRYKNNIPMKSTTILFLMISFLSNAQTLKRFESYTTSTSVSALGLSTGTISLLDTPSVFCSLQFDVPDSISNSHIRASFFKYFHGDEKDYDCWSASQKFSSCSKCRYVEVRIICKGIGKEMTFAELKKIIYP